MTSSAQVFTTNGTYTAPNTLINSGVYVGAGGAAGTGGGAGKGGFVAGFFTLAPGDSFNVVVGQQGAGSAAGTGHSAGGTGGVGGGGLGGGGGGSSAVLKSSVLYIEAAGGGGSGSPGQNGGTNGGPGGGGGAASGAGATGGTVSGNVGGGGGGGASLSAGGTGGAPGAGSSGGSGGAGASGSTHGGNAGNGQGGVTAGGAGGGGGGGYQCGGGGGGGGDDSVHGGGGGGGGGGCSYALTGTLLNEVYFTDNNNTGSGLVTVTYTYADPPYAPTLGPPATATYVELGGTPTFEFTYQPGADSGALSTWAFRMKLSSSGTYNYWTSTGPGAGNFTSTTRVENPAAHLTPIGGQSFTYTFPSGAFANGNTYDWSVATVESHYPSINIGPFATDNVVIGQPAPTVVINQPTSGGDVASQILVVNWTTTPGAGLSQTAYRLMLYTAAQVAAPGFTPGVSPGIFDGGTVSSAAQSHTIGSTDPSPALANGDTYWAYLQVTETNAELSTWASAEFTLVFSGPAQPTLVATALNDPSTGAPYTELVATVVNNAIGWDDSSFENDDIGTWTGVNCSLAAGALWAADGTYSLVCTATAAAANTIQNQGGTSGIPVTPGQVVTAIGTVQQVTLGQAHGLQIQWYTSGGSLISASTVETVNASPGGTTAYGWATAPATAAFAAIGWTWTATAIGQTTRVDAMGLFYGMVSQWSLGGYLNQATTTVTVQYSDDGGTTWANTRFGQGMLVPSYPAAPVVSCTDYAAPPGNVRQYQAICSGYNGEPLVLGIVPGEPSAPESTTTTTNGLVFLSDPLDPTTAVGCVLTGQWKPVIPEQMTRYWPIGRKFGIKTTDGTKGISGSVDLVTVSQADRLRLQSLLAGVETMLLQLPQEAYYVSIDGDRGGAVEWPTMGPVSEYSQSTYSVPYVQAAMP